VVKANYSSMQKNFQNVKLDVRDYSDLLNSVQRHTRCNSSYCLRFNDSNQESYCRFRFPFELCNCTKIEFEKIHTKKKKKLNINP